jgi:tetratricopeptide (TPR) repeat protein
MTTRPIRRELQKALLFAALVCARAAHADPHPPETAVVDASAAFQRGLALYDAGDYTGAVTIWEALHASLGEARGWKVLFNLGLAYQAIGDATRAIERYEAFLREAVERGAPGDAELIRRREDAAGRVRALKSAYGALVVRAPASGTPVMTSVGGDVRSAGYTLWVSPGEHQVEVGTGTPRARRVRVDVVAGGAVEVTTDDLVAPPQVPAAPPVAPAPAPATQRPAEGRRFPTLAVVLASGATVASAAVPLGLGLRASAKRSDAAAFGQGNTGYASAVGDFHDARTLYYASYSIPAVLAAVTATVAVFGIASSAVGPRVEVAPAADQRGASLWACAAF